MSTLVEWKNGRIVGGVMSRALSLVRYDNRSPAVGGQLWDRDLAEIALAEAEEILKPAGSQFGVKQARVLLAAFPNRDNSDDPKVYVRAIAAVLAACPEEIGRQVVRDVVLSHKYGLPPAAVVAERAEELMAPLIAVKYAAEAQLRAWRRKEANKPKPKQAESNFSDEQKIQMLDYLSPELRAFIASGESEDVQKAAKQMIAGAVKRPPKPETHINGQWTDDGWQGHGERKAVQGL